MLGGFDVRDETEEKSDLANLAQDILQWQQVNFHRPKQCGNFCKSCDLVNRFKTLSSHVRWFDRQIMSALEMILSKMGVSYFIALEKNNSLNSFWPFENFRWFLSRCFWRFAHAKPWFLNNQIAIKDTKCSV